MFIRTLFDTLHAQFFSGKILFLLGSRQVGKTTLARELIRDIPTKEVIQFNGDYPGDKAQLNFASQDDMERLLSPYRWILIDEWQKIPHIGDTLKMMVDFYKESKTIIVTGSSSIHLLDQTNEPLTGRKRVYTLYPLSWWEIREKYGLPDAFKKLESLLIYGSYPETVLAISHVEKQKHLREIITSQLYRDILEFQDIKKSPTITKLLELLALQVGSEVSYHSLATILGISQATVERYIDLLEKSFIIFELRPYFTNKIKEVTKMKKIYFYDLGIRNAILSAFQPLHLRKDTGALFENFFLLEKKKNAEYTRSWKKYHFWRTQKWQEIDIIEITDSVIESYEIQWSEKSYTPPTEWIRLYPGILPTLIHRENFWKYL